MPNITAAYQWAVQTCNNPKVGYSQKYRNEQTYGGITYYDCSSFIWYSLVAGGFDVKTAYATAKGYAYSGNAITTDYERPWLQALGFQSVPITGEWKPGDVLWRSGHTEMVYEGGRGRGRSMGAHGPGEPLVHNGRPLASQVSIVSTYSSRANWTSLYRYGSGASGMSVSAPVIAAMCGCFWRESQVNPGIWESLIPCAWDFQYDFTHKGGYGLGQWTNYGTPHGRTWNLHEWVNANGYTDGDGNGQCAFLVHEQYWSNSSQTRGSYTTLNEFLATDSTNLADLVWDFLANWEGVPGNAYDFRLEKARMCLEYLRAHAGDDPSSFTWTSENAYISEAQSLANVMCIYFFFQGYDPGNDPLKHGKRGMPVWMMIKYF